MSTRKRQESRRGILHPCCLVAIQKKILLEFYVIKSVLKVEKFFLDGAIRNVSAAFVRGREDIAIKSYIDVAACGTEVPRLTVPFSYMSANEFAATFDTEYFTPELRVLINPQDILKVRGAVIPEETEAQRIERSRLIGRTLGFGDSFRPSVCREIARIASSMEMSESIPAPLSHVFLTTIELRSYESRRARQSYLFVAAEDDHGEERERALLAFIRRRFYSDDRVRDIYRISDLDWDRHTRRLNHKSRFQFVMKLKCSAEHADDLLYAIHKWADEEGIRVGTRTYDFWRHIKHDAINVIADGGRSNASFAFLSSVFRMDPAAPWKSDEFMLEKVRAVAIPWERHGELVEGISSCKNSVQMFYESMYLSSAANHNNIDFLDNSTRAWGALFMTLEDLSRQLIAKGLGLLSDAPKEDIKVALVRKFNPDARSLESNACLAWLVKWGEEIFGIDSRAVKSVKEHNSAVREVRNYTAHGDNALKWKEFIDLSDSQWRRTLEVVVERTARLCAMIVEVNREVLN